MAGVHWLQTICAALEVPAEETFRVVMSSRYPGVLKAPFNDMAREQAGLTASWYALCLSSSTALLYVRMRCGILPLPCSPLKVIFDNRLTQAGKSAGQLGSA